MTQERVLEMLTRYRENKARCGHLRCEIASLERLVESLKATIVDDEVHITQVITDMPRGTTTSDPTARVGTMLADGVMPARITEVEDEVKAKRNELAAMEIEVLFVEAWLTSLTDRERFCVESKYVEGACWREMLEQYRERFDSIYSRNTLKHIVSGGLEKIYRVAR